MTKQDIIICSKCGEEKPRYQPRSLECQDCALKRVRAHKKTPHGRAVIKAYREEYKKRPGNKEKIKAYHKEYNKRPHVKERYRHWQKEYNQRPEVKIKNRKQARIRGKKKRLDADFRIEDALRTRLSIAIKENGDVKYLSTEELLGYTIKEYVKFIKSLGYDSKIHHIDHIIPVVWFRKKYKGKPEVWVRKAWEFGNLRIMTIEENCSKGAKLPPDFDPSIY